MSPRCSYVLVLLLVIFFINFQLFLMQRKLKTFNSLYQHNILISYSGNDTRKLKETDISLNFCFLDPTMLQTRLIINYNQLKSNYLKLSRQVTSASQFRRLYSPFVPTGCTPILTVAIIIPIRNRKNHLHILLGHLHPFLQKQLLSLVRAESGRRKRKRKAVFFTTLSKRYKFYVVHQTGNRIFNKGRLMNTGFQYAVEDGEKSGNPYDCFIFHDVDLLPESELNLYRCGRSAEADSKHSVYHLAHTVDKFAYQTMCCGITVGGVVAFTRQQYQEVNGYSNEYWGWGGEDDDMNARIRHKGYSIERVLNDKLSRYKMIRHVRDKLNPKNNHVYSLLSKTKRISKYDGLSNLRTNITSISFFPLYVNISVDVGLPG